MSSETLQVIHIPVEDWATCQEKVPFDFKGKVIEDKVWFLFSVLNSFLILSISCRSARATWTGT